MNRKLVLIIALTLLIGMLSVASNVQKAYASGTIYIRSDGSIDPPTANIATFDNVTYTLTGIISSDGDGIVVERDNIVIDGAGQTLQGNGNGIDLTERVNVTIKGARTRGFASGVYLNNASFCGIYGNHVTNNDAGIYLKYSSSNTISGNNITLNYNVAIGLNSSSGNSISGNNITANSGDGIRLGYSSNYNLISGNNITDNEGGGIWLYSSSNYNSILGNDITDTEFGIILDSSSNYNIISGNNITANNWSGIWLNFASSNKFYHNNFIGNTQQVHTIVTPAYANFWDDAYPSGGNYWGDYNGTDANHDGIGDTPYVIDANNTDRYPLITPYIIPEFPSFLVLPLFTIATMLAVIVYRKKHAKISGTQ